MPSCSVKFDLKHHTVSECIIQEKWGSFFGTALKANLKLKNEYYVKMKSKMIFSLIFIGLKIVVETIRYFLSTAASGDFRAIVYKEYVYVTERFLVLFRGQNRTQCERAFKTSQKTGQIWLMKVLKFNLTFFKKFISRKSFVFILTAQWVISHLCLFS